MLALGAATILAVGGTVAAAVQAGRDSLDLTASFSSRFVPRLGPDGRVVNAYDVALENRGRQKLTLLLALAPEQGRATVSPERVELAPGEHRKVFLVASASGLGPGPVVQAELVARQPGGDTVRAQVPMFLPRTP